MTVKATGKEVGMEYIGTGRGDAIWYGATGRRYRAGGVTRTFPVDEADVNTFLNIRVGHQAFFKCTEPVEPEPVEEPKPARRKKEAEDDA